MKRQISFAYPLLLAGLLAAVAGCSKKPVQMESGVKPAPEPPAKSTEVRAADRDFPHTSGSPGDGIGTENLAGNQGTLKDAFFDFDKSDIRADQREPLTADGSWLRQHSTADVRIEGHCDERGTAQYNLALGERRAESVKEYLVDLGVDSKRIKTISYGKERPFAQGHDESAWALNRRDHFAIASK